jgi:hypothetical protein
VRKSLCAAAVLLAVTATAEQAHADPPARRPLCRQAVVLIGHDQPTPCVGTQILNHVRLHVTYRLDVDLTGWPIDEALADCDHAGGELIASDPTAAGFRLTCEGVDK